MGAERVRMAEGAGLVGDREYALFDARGRVLNAKRLGSRILSIRAEYGECGRRVELAAGSERLQCELATSRADMGSFFSRALGESVTIRRDSRPGFPDDAEATGPTLLGTGSIATVAGWFGMSLGEVRRRFRANLEIEGLEPFEEDLLFGPPGGARPFRIGEVDFQATNPCARCVVPTLDSRGGAGQGELSAARFAVFRRRFRRRDSAIESYGHYYRLAVNTVLAPGQAGKTLSLGDELVRLS